MENLQFERRAQYNYKFSSERSEPTVTRIWRPNVTDLTNNQVRNRVQNTNERNVKVSLEHQKLQPDQIRGFNSGPRQFGSNPQPAQKSDNQMRSEVLKMIQENEQHRGQRPQNFGNNKGLLPNCFCCGRPIVGVMVTAFDLSLHSDCFQCSTCGTNLANQGHHFLNDKFYCDVHGRQRKVQLGDRLGADKQKSSSAAPLTQQVRPFLSSSVNGNTLPSTRRDTKNEEERPFKRVPIDSNEVNRLSSAFTGLRTRGPVTKPQAFNEPSRWSQNDVLGANAESPKCAECKRTIAGSFVKAAGKTYCPEHFNCANGACNRRLIECGFVEENGKKYCEKCFETLIAPDCAKCGLAITAECLNALQKHWHPQCFTCTHCRQSFGNAAFYVENNQPYCERDWNQLFTAKCTSCTFPIEAGDKWVEALGGQFHTNCFNCTVCHISLEGQTFYAREGRPFCKSHA